MDREVQKFVIGGLARAGLLLLMPAIFLGVLLTTDLTPKPVVIEGTESNINRILEISEKPVVVIYGADWCPSCQTFKPVIQQANEFYAGKIQFVEVNTDKQPEISNGIDYLPTTVVYRNGLILTAHVGGMTLEGFKRFLKITLHDI